MSWDDTLNNYVLNYQNYDDPSIETKNATDGAVIFDVDKNIYAQVGNIELRVGKVDQEQEDGTVKKIDVDEIDNLMDYHKNGGTTSKAGGVRIAGVKYFAVGQNKQFDSYILKSSNGGACLAKTATLYILAIYNKSKKATLPNGSQVEQNPSLCNEVVQKLQEYYLNGGY
jgi:hypothetical protein